MKYFNTLLLVAFLGIATSTFAQRYISEVFTDVSVSTAVYGKNASFISLLDPDPNNNAHPLVHPLVMDVYQPVGDTETDRPIVLFFHTGNFLPHPANGGTGGLRTDSVAVEICTRLAKMGYVAASVDYRLGWNPIDPSEQNRRFLLINAAWRGVQDANTCIRYLKKTVAEGGNPLGIDPNRIVLWGTGTGGYISTNAGALDAYAKTLIPKFILSTPIGPVPMIIEQVNGNVEGTSVGLVIPNYPIFTPGDTLSYPNHVGYSSDFQLAVNMGGAIGDTSWIDPGQPPIISFHVPTDPFAPYVEGIVYVPVTPPLAVVEVQGSYLIQKLANEFGNNDAFANHEWIDPYTAVADTRNDGYDGLFPFPIQDTTGNDPWNFWAWNNANATELSDSIGAKLYIDSIMNYYAPRACLVLDLGCNLSGFSAADEVPAAQVQLQISPNPAIDNVQFNTAAEFPMESVYVFDLNGRLVKAHVDIHDNHFTMPRNSLQAGMYVAKVVFKHGFTAQRILYR